MSAAVFNHRRIERFAQLLDGSEAGIRRHGRDPLDRELAGYVAFRDRLGEFDAAVDATPDPDFRTGLRAMLVATAEREGVGGTTDADEGGRLYQGAAATRRPLLGGRRGRAAIVVGIAGTLALSGMSVASGDALPGDPLYGVKRSTENARLALAGSDIDRGQAYLGFARNRAGEAAGVRSDAGRLLPALNDMNDETTQGVRLLTTAAVARRDPAALGIIDDFVEAQRPAVAALQAGLSGTALAHAEQSLALLDKVGGRVADLRAGLSCTTGNGPVDALGPVPARCGGPATAGQGMPPGAHAGAGALPGPTGAHPEATGTGRVAGPSPTTAPSADAASPAPPSSGGGLLGELGHLLGSIF